MGGSGWLLVKGEPTSHDGNEEFCYLGSHVSSHNLFLLPKSFLEMGPPGKFT